jgi:hypothetical protein
MQSSLCIAFAISDRFLSHLPDAGMKGSKRGAPLGRQTVQKATAPMPD